MKIAFLGNFGVDYSSENHHAKSLESLGHEVIRIQEGKATAMDLITKSVGCEVLIWVHTHGWNTEGDIEAVIKALKGNGCKVISYHLDLWFGIERQKDLEADPFYKRLDWFFATDKLMCDWFNENTDVKGYYLPAGVYDKECYMAERQGDYKHDVVFVGSRGYHHEWSYRPQLVDWLKETYGDRFAHYGGDGIKVVRGAELNQLYADSRVVVGDSLCLNFDYPYYWSDRIYETTGRGGLIIHPYIKGLEDSFNIYASVDNPIKQEIITYKFGDFDELKQKIDMAINPSFSHIYDELRLAGHERTKRDHTYVKRWEKILEVISG